MATGFLIVNVYIDTIAQPAENVTVEIVGGAKYKTNVYGKTPKISLYAPEKEYSEHYQDKVRPYSVYTIKVSKEGLRPVIVEGVEVLPDETSLQDVYMHEIIDITTPETIIIPEHELWGEHPPKIVEAPIKSEKVIEAQSEAMPTASPSAAQPRVLTRVLIPEYIIVHDGIPSNTSAANYYVTFPDYLKNVASSEIYSTWPRETLKANIHAIASFTLNRIFTEWYRARGYSFTITSTPQYDQKYAHGRTIFASIAAVVDEYFSTYIKLPNLQQPLFAQYNDGVVTNNAGWLSQWGSKELGDKGNTALQILRHYYGNHITLDTAKEIEGLPTSFPGYNLTIDSCGEAVQKMQYQLNTIRANYPGIPLISPANGVFNQSTKNAVMKFQQVFNLAQDGVVGFATWYKIAYVYIAVAGLMANK